MLWLCHPVLVFPVVEQLEQHQCLVVAEADDDLVTGVIHAAHHGLADTGRSCRRVSNCEQRGAKSLRRDPVGTFCLWPPQVYLNWKSAVWSVPSLSLRSNCWQVPAHDLLVFHT